jgi:dihydroflavonol-4-reductase
MLKRQPRIPVDAVKASRKNRHFDCSKAVRELGLAQTPVEEAFEKAIRWFIQNGYSDRH